jgi:signal transduction histidine kinase/CheY-like chemotaxis protein
MEGAMQHVLEVTGPRRTATAEGPLEHLISHQDRERLLSFLVGQSRILEMIAEAAPLPDTLDKLMRVLEGQAEGMICSVLLLSEDGRRLRHGAAPSLPDGFARSIEDLEIGPSVGSCGTAAYHRRQVIVTDIARDPLWAGPRDVALAAGLRACWSTPIISTHAEVLGTFAIYYREPTGPSPLHLALIGLATHLAGIAIERNRAERERMRLVRELDVERRALENAGRHKDQFLAMLAHELRNPLAAIGNAVAVARQRLSRSQDIEGPLAVLERQVRNSSHLLDDLLDVARFNRGMVEIRKEPVRLDEVVAGAVDAQRAIIEGRGHQLTVSLPDEPVIVEGDATRLEQVVTNLLNNAAKYTPDGGRLGIAVARLDGEATVAVRDDGLGISADLLPYVFDLFVQADRSLARSQGGLGLGLALVNTLVAMHGGTVQAFSEGPGKGSEFVVRLPVLERARVSPRAPPPTADSQPRVSGRILLVEDNVDAADTLKEVLGTFGHTVEAVHDGPSALQMASRFGADLALIDIGLPGMDGFEVARRLRADLQENTPVMIALTGYGQEEDRERSRLAGIDTHLTKPFELTQLERLIQEILRRSRRPRPAARGPSA